MTAHPLFKEARQILCYLSTEYEADTSQIIRAAFSAGKQVAAPKVLSKTKMEFFRLDSPDALVKGAYGIREPASEILADASPSLVLMPGVAFDRQNRRIGYGGGYYDRYLKAHPEHRTIALAFSMQVVPVLPAEPHDIRPEYLITETDSFLREGGKIMQENLPKDPVMLLSVVNTKLRDFYPDLETMCRQMQADGEWIVNTLARLDYHYDAQKNQFV